MALKDDAPLECWSIPIPSSSDSASDNMPKFEHAIEIMSGEDADDEVIKQCATLFSDHYATWGAEAERTSSGRCVKGISIASITD